MRYKFQLLFGLFFFPILLSAQIQKPVQNFVLRFDGNSIARAPLNSQLNLSNSFTMELWVYVESYSPYTVIFGKPHYPRGSDPFMSYVIEIGNSDSFEFVQSTGQPGTYRSVTATQKVELNKWTHVAAVLSNQNMKLYINGVEVASGFSEGSSNNTTIPFGVGAGADAAGNISSGGFAGSIMQARVWNYPLSENEIKTVSSKVLSGTENGLIVCWPLNDGSGGQALSIGNTNLPLSLGTSSGSNKPMWTRSTLLDSLNLFFQSKPFKAPSTMRIVNETIPFDYDADGDFDIILLDHWWPPTFPGTQMPITIMKNDGKGNFETVNEAWVGNIKFVHPRHWTIADFDKDGKKDLIIVDHGTDITPFPGDQSRYLKTNQSGIFIEETNTRMPIVNAFTHNVASADIDNDGDIDVYMCNISGTNVISPRIYLNDGTGKFSMNETRLPSIITSFQKKYMSSSFVDIDKDGDYDLILGGHDGTNPNEFFPTDAILLNNGKGEFSFAPDNSMPDRTFGSAGGTVAITSGDFNNDGWPDLIMSTLLEYKQGAIQLLINNGNGTFRDESNGIIQSWPISKDYGNSWIKWIYPADFNNDGKLDFIAIGQNESMVKVYLNAGNLKFKEITEYMNLNTDIQNCAVADFDGDNRIDIAAFQLDGKGVYLKNSQNFVITSIENINNEIPTELFLSNAYPNPFNPETAIEFSIPEDSDISLKVFNLLGKEVATLRKGFLKAGNYKNIFNGQNLSSGLYFYQLQTDNKLITKKMLMIK